MQDTFTDHGALLLRADLNKPNAEAEAALKELRGIPYPGIFLTFPG